MAKGGSGYSKQAGGGFMSDEVNISFVLDMQRKLYRWSNEDPDKSLLIRSISYATAEL
jgi:hypothetical protein